MILNAEISFDILYQSQQSMQANQTPFQYIQRKDRQRKQSILSNIEQKDLKRRSISYNFKKSYLEEEKNAQKEHKDETKEHLNHININNSIKKSYFYRKLMNKSIDSHLTSEDFQRVKQKFDNINSKEVKDNKTIFFRQVWEREQLRKYAVVYEKDQQNYLQVVARNSDKYKTVSHESETHKKKKEIAKSILDIASQRRTSLNFDLQILGNKKSIRIKDNISKLHKNINSNQKTIGTDNPQPNQTSKIQQRKEEKTLNFSKQSESQEKREEAKPACSFFKRLQQERPQKKFENGNQFLQITKLSQTMFPVTNNYQLENIKLKKLQLKEYQSEMEEDYTAIIRREIQSSWRPNTRLSSEKPKKLETSHDRRASILQQKKAMFPNFTNDIKGWMVRQENEDQLLQNLPE